MGYSKAQSLASLKMGSIFGIAMIALGLMMAWECAYSFIIALGIAAVLSCFFVIRLLLTGKWMPSGVMAMISLVATLIFLWHYWKG